MTKMDYLKLLVDEIHSTTVATIGSDGHPQTRIIDMMYYDEEGVYFLTAKGKAFFDQLMDQQYVAISATKDKISALSGELKQLRGEVKLCESIAERSSLVKEGLEAIIEQEHSERKEKSKYEHSRRRSGTDRQNVTGWRGSGR